MDEDVVVWWLLRWLSQVLTPDLVGGIVLAVLLVAVVGLLTVGLVFLRFRRHPNVRQALLRLRAEHLADGPEAEVIDLRLHLREQMEAARRAVASIGSAGELAGELPAVFQQLERAADRLDHYLQVLERSVADGGSYRSLGQARRRVAEVVTAARDVRRAALSTLDVTATGEIQAIRRAVEEEVTWVQSAVEAMDDLSGPERTPRRSGPSSSGG